MTSVMAIGAHPDDIELGCCATLLKHKEGGDHIYLLVLTRGEASADAYIREEECRKAAEIIEADGLFFSELQDTKIHDDAKTITAIEKIIEQVKPKIIYTHSYKDTHQDHRNAGYASLSAARRIKKILMYESPTTFREFSPQFFVDISRHFDKKKSVLRSYSSQSGKEWWAVGDSAALAIEGLAAYRGFQAGVKVAEAFEVGRIVLSAEEPVFSNNASS